MHTLVTLVTCRGAARTPAIGTLVLVNEVLLVLSCPIGFGYARPCAQVPNISHCVCVWKVGGRVAHASRVARCIAYDEWIKTHAQTPQSHKCTQNADMHVCASRQHTPRPSTHESNTPAFEEILNCSAKRTARPSRWLRSCSFATNMCTCHIFTHAHTHAHTQHT